MLADDRRHGVGGEQHDHADEHGDRLLGADAERHHLAAHDVGLVDGEHVGVGVDVLAQRLPRAAHEQRVAGLELDAGVAERHVVAQHAPRP